MSSLQLNCPHCRAPVPADAAQPGQIVRCPGCGTELRIPEAPWFYQTNGQLRGPVTRGRLRDLVSRGDLQAADLVRQDGAGDWLLAAQVVAETPSFAP